MNEKQWEWIVPVGLLIAVIIGAFIYNQKLGINLALATILVAALNGMRTGLFKFPAMKKGRQQ